MLCEPFLGNYHRINRPPKNTYQPGAAPGPETVHIITPWLLEDSKTPPPADKTPSSYLTTASLSLLI